MRTRARAADPVAVDVPYLGTSFDIPEPDIQTLLEEPTAELVSSFLASLTSKAQEYDTFKAEKLRTDVELESIVRTSESKVKAQKAAATRSAKEVEELRGKLAEAEGARERLASELEQLRSSTSRSTAETTTLRQRIATLEASNRDALALVESKSTEKDRLATELSEQHTKLLALRKEISQLEERNSSLENAASSQKFKEQSLQQEIGLLKRNNEWHTNELQTRSQEHAKFRKERNARIASLQHELEDSTASVETLKRTQTTLRQRLEELQTKADESFAKIASLEEDAARQQQSFKTELDSSKRLGELQAQNAGTHKARLAEIQGQVEQVKEDAAEEIGRLQAEIETERSDKEGAERKVAELELQVERLESQPRVSGAGTPVRNGFGGDPSTPVRAGGSPSAMPGSARKTAKGLSFTQLYSQYTDMQAELEAEKRRTAKLQTALDELMQHMESNAAEWEESRAAFTQLEEEVFTVSQMLDETKEKRDAAVREAQGLRGDVAANQRQEELLRQQLRDLSTQVKILLVEIKSRDQGLEEMSAQERLELERAARGELDDDIDQGSVSYLISSRLVIFRDVSTLQAQNEQLLRVVRDLGDKMEGEEARQKAAKSAADAEELSELRASVERYKDELQATAIQIDSYIKERDMFRRMLQHRGKLPAGDQDLESMFGQSVVPATPQRNAPDASGAAETPQSKEVEGLYKILKEHQANFDTLRDESREDRRQLSDKVAYLERERSTLQSDLARVQSQLTLAGERYEMLQSNFAALRSENTELQKRSQSAAEQAARQDLRTQQVAEELVEARGVAESLRNENANSKAEKELWKRIEARLTEDNKSLMDERSRLNRLVTDLQNLQNERELADSETRRRLQARTEGLESELADTKRKLEAEVEESRKAALRREYEEGQSRTRIDDLVKSLGNFREELVAAKTTRDQLQSRVDEMKIELRAAEERAAALQPRPTPRTEPAAGEPQTNGDANELPAEQRLALEASELRRDLELTKAELESARQQVEQYKSIAHSTEEELASFNETSEQYREETDALLASNTTRIAELEQRIADLGSELTTSNNQLSELRTKHDDASHVLAEQSNAFEADLARLRDDADRYAEEKNLLQQDLRAQADIAQQAQQSYEDELLKHAEAARSLHSVRKEYNELRTEVAGVRTEAEVAKQSLENGEESWAAQQEAFERELSEVRRRHADVGEQNKLLHEQMESFSQELAALRQGRAGLAVAGEDAAGSPSRGDNGNLQEVIKFLRREKEIVDVQYELSIQEAKRLQQQLDYANSQLEAQRQKLAEERRQSSNRLAEEGSTNKLMQTINELNLFRESSTTLRNEARQARERLEEKAKEFERLVAELEPLKARVGELEGELEVKESENKLLQDDRDHWRERTQNIISKYDRVDPDEVEAYKNRIAELQAENSQCAAELEPLRHLVEGAEQREQEVRDRAEEEAKAVWTPKLEKFKEQAKDQNRKQNSRVAEANAARVEAERELEALKAELEALRAEQDLKQGELEALQAQLQEARKAPARQQEEDAEEGQVREDGTAAGSGEEHAQLHKRIAEAEAAASEHVTRADALQAEVQAMQARVQELEGQLADLQQQLETANAGGAEDGEVQEHAASVDGGANAEALENLQQELTAARQEVEALKTKTTDDDDNAGAPTQDQPVAGSDSVHDEASFSQRVQQEVDKQTAELKQQHELAIKQTEEERDRKIQAMKNNLTRQLKEEREKMRGERDELVIQHSGELQRLRDEHDALVEKLKLEHQSELGRLKREGEAAVEKAQAKEQAEPAVETSSAVKAEPEQAGSMAKLEISEEQAVELLKSSARLRNIFTRNVAQKTEPLQKAIAEKDAEIERLKEAQQNPAHAATADPASPDADKEQLAKKLEALQAERDELTAKLEAAEKDKDAAIRQATDNAEKKAKVQISQRDMAQAKIAVVSRAATETPEKPVGEVWEIAKVAKPVPKLVPGAAAAAVKPATPSSPAQAQPSPAAPPAGQTEQQKLQARQERFGTPAPATSSSPAPQPATAPTFGQPSRVPTSTPSTFGQPSQQGALSARARRPSGAQGPSNTPNPQAATFTPNTQQNVGTGPAALRGLSSGIPRVGATGIPRGAAVSGRGGAQGISIQGAAAASQGVAQRGGAHPGPPHGGGGGSGGRGGRGGRGGAQPANAGQKRSFDGGEGGDAKRSRGGSTGA